jgi:hypothetical protein
LWSAQSSMGLAQASCNSATDLAAKLVVELQPPPSAAGL